MSPANVLDYFWRNLNGFFFYSPQPAAAHSYAQRSWLISNAMISIRIDAWNHKSIQNQRAILWPIGPASYTRQIERDEMYGSIRLFTFFFPPYDKNNNDIFLYCTRYFPIANRHHVYDLSSPNKTLRTSSLHTRDVVNCLFFGSTGLCIQFDITNYYYNLECWRTFSWNVFGTRFRNKNTIVSDRRDVGIGPLDGGFLVSYCYNYVLYSFIVARNELRQQPLKEKKEIYLNTITTLILPNYDASTSQQQEMSFVCTERSTSIRDLRFRYTV